MLGAGRLLTLFSPFITTQKEFVKETPKEEIAQEIKDLVKSINNKMSDHPSPTLPITKK